MPTIIQMKGWRVFFFANERGEPMHVHCKKGNASCKFWILPDIYEIKAEYLYGTSPGSLREIEKNYF